MNGFPDPDQTPSGPQYEGRLLARLDEPVVDQGAGFDLGTLITRRGILGLVGLGVSAATLAACAPLAGGTTTTPTASTWADSGTGTTSTGEIPDETAGPYPGDGSNGPDVLEQSGIVRSDIRTSIGSATAVEGVPLTFTFTVTDMANGNVPFENVAVYAWHCDAEGRYSMYSSGVENETWLRGVQVADANGQVTFTSIVPGCYSGRWPHIHFEVYPDLASITDSSNAIATSQLAFPEDMLGGVYALASYPSSAQNLSQISLASDNVFGDDGGVNQLPTMTGDLTNGYQATLAVGVDTTTTPSGGSAPSRMPGGQPGAGPAD